MAAGNLRERLRRIQDNKKAETPRAVRQSSADISNFTQKEWASCGFQTLKRVLTEDTALDVPALPEAAPVLIPDLGRIAGTSRSLPELQDFLFFDLETTGLSGGAGTVAFLAAFGRYVRGSANTRALRITQYLLLDYPGENDFLEAVLGEFKQEPLVIVTYNGKTFDSQILKTRCLMNGIRPPEYSHADLLHPARRLWKRILPDCSQGTIETAILGLDRSGDIPGAMAPEIWFSFLKTGDTGPLMDICEHNRRDISGLAAILAAMIHIARDPCATLEQYHFDIEALVLRWREYARQSGDIHNDSLRAAGAGLLRLAVKQKCPKATLVYALDQLRSGNYNEGRKRLLNIATAASPQQIQAAAFRALAIDSERRLGNAAQALGFARQGLALETAGAACRKEFERRAERLERKVFITEAF